MKPRVSEKKITGKPKKKHTQQQLESMSMNKLKKGCIKNGLPFKGLKKSQVINNIMAWESGQKPPFQDLQKEWKDYTDTPRPIPILVRDFCFKYANQMSPKTNAEWAKEFGVKPVTISKWISRKDVKELIAKFMTDKEERLLHLFSTYEVEAVEELMNIIRTRKPTELKRKAIFDMLGFAGRKNTNNRNVIIKQGQFQGQSSENNNLLASKTDKEIDEELEELESIIEE